MKKTRLAIILVVFGIILSFFASIYAAETNQFSVNDKNVVNCRENQEDGSLVITASAEAPSNDSDNSIGEITFVPKVTGVYNFNVEGIDRGAGEDLYYHIVDPTGKYVRLAAYYDEKTGEYVTFSNRNDDKQTNVDVLLIAGQKYTVELPNYGRGGPQFAIESFVNANYPNQNYKITIKPNESEHNIIGKIYQSNESSSRITTSVNGDTLNDEKYLEKTVEPYKMPEGTKAKYDGHGVGDAVSSLGNSVKNKAKEYVVNPLEETICELLLALGDFLVNLMNTVIGEEVTITKLVYNQVDAVNANFFDKSITGSGVTADIKNVVNDWYNVFKMIAIAIYIVVLLAIGINILLSSTGNGMTKAKELLTQWLKGIVALVFIPYIIKYAFLLNEALVGMLRESAGVPDYSIGSNFNAAEEWSLEEIEFRSPEYVSKYTGSIAFGSDEASEAYMKKLDSYEQNLDLMRIMRAFAGVTKKMIYVVIWFILIGQLITFIVQYYKRYFIIAFLIAMFPIVCIFHGISIAQGSSKGEMGSWVKEILTNIFVQFVHAIIYTVITGICISVVKDEIQTSTNLNWIIIILAINFVAEGERLLRRLLGAMGSTAESSGQTSKGIKGLYGKAKSQIKRFTTGKDPDKEKEDE